MIAHVAHLAPVSRCEDLRLANCSSFFAPQNLFLVTRGGPYHSGKRCPAHEGPSTEDKRCVQQHMRAFHASLKQYRVNIVPRSKDPPSTSSGAAGLPLPPGQVELCHAASPPIHSLREFLALEPDERRWRSCVKNRGPRGLEAAKVESTN